jgi:hypothetical protein
VKKAGRRKMVKSAGYRKPDEESWTRKPDEESWRRTPDEVGKHTTTTTVFVAYPSTGAPYRFDRDYYVSRHLPLFAGPGSRTALNRSPHCSRRTAGPP